MNVPAVPAVNATALANQENSPTLTAAELDSQSNVQSDEKIAGLVKAGLLSVNGSDYLIEIKLQQGQLLVNGMPFNPGMLQF